MPTRPFPITRCHLRILSFLGRVWGRIGGTDFESRMGRFYSLTATTN